ncbi:MAG: calcium/sodium antiporter [Hyphomonadaceae bacterium]
MSDMLIGPIVFLVAGFAVLIYSADCLVRGALSAAYKANVSPLLVGIVIVGFGTSLPEFLISAQAATSGSAGLAHGNIIGSNIANILLVLALPALIFPITTVAHRMRITAFFMLACTAAWIGISMYFGLTQWVGTGFLLTLAAYAIIAWSVDRKDTTEDTKEELKMMHTPMWRMIMLILIGIVGLPLGSRLLVDGGISLGHELHASETIVGLTLLAVGSSIPELGASIAAAVRKQSDVAMGNIIGANIFNILGAGGVVSILAPRAHISPEFTAFSNWVMIGAALLLTLVVFLKRRVGVATALIFLALYGLYLYGLWDNWSFQGLGDLIIAPSAHSPN